MYSLKERIFLSMPHVLQNALVTIFDLQYYRKQAGKYREHKRYHERLYGASLAEQCAEQNRRLREILRFAYRNSPYYHRLWGEIDVEAIENADDLSVLPSVTKEDIRSNIEDIATVGAGNAYVAHTGGTTGKSLEIFYTWPDFQERQAVLDFFREQFGWRLGKKTAWFSGKNLLGDRDIARRRFWKTDVWFNIRYYSTFHLSQAYLPSYLKNLNRYKPEFFSGFPSNIYELASFAKRTGFRVTCRPKAVFTTAETLVPEQTAVIEEVFGTKVYDQYSSSEGAPFVVQCRKGAYHFLPWTGVIELLDEKGRPAQREGEVCITYFHSHGTPLVRYRLGDRMRFAPEGTECECGSRTPIVERIEGRRIDFLYSRERGRINLGNVSNCVKNTPGILKFQAVQEKVDTIKVAVVVDPEVHDENERAVFTRELRNRLGKKIHIEVNPVDFIPRESSGKFRIVKNLVPEQCE